MTSSLNAEQLQKLVDRAVEAQRRAYAPYSNYLVGAALLTSDGTVFTGCNVENAASPATICAERTAVTKAVSEGHREFTAIAVVTRDGGSPCGICRQVLNEFAPNILVIVANGDGRIQYTHRLPEMLLHAFGPSNLETNEQ
jgi:cytidine deaminase